MEDTEYSRYRQPEFPVDSLFPRRWSPRAMSGEEITRGELMSLFEAARWAPSSNNNQPWRFIYCLRSGPAWETFFGLLDEGNKVWCKNAAALIVAVSKTTFDSGKPARTHSFDTGAAWMSLALQGTLMGLVVHGMQGFDYDRAKTELGVPDEYAVEAMIAVGRHGRVEDLPDYKRVEEFPKGRKSVGEFVFVGRFGG